jgi:hypothetical protein
VFSEILEAIVECADGVAPVAGREASPELAVSDPELFERGGEGVSDIAKEFGGFLVSAGSVFAGGEFAFGVKAGGLGIVLAVLADPAPEFRRTVVGEPVGGVAGAADREVERLVHAVGPKEVFEPEFFGLWPVLSEAVCDAATEVGVALFAQVAVDESTCDVVEQSEGIAPRVDIDASDEAEFAEFFQDGPMGLFGGLLVVEFFFEDNREQAFWEGECGDAEDFDQKLLSSVQRVEASIEQLAKVRGDDIVGGLAGLIAGGKRGGQ